MALNSYKNTLKKKPMYIERDGTSTAPINNPSFQNAFDAYKTQLELSKVNAKNEVAKSTRVAANYLDNYLKQYGLRGSGLGQSAYTNLAAQQATANANINAEQRSKLNENVLTEGKELLSGYTDAQAQNYINNLKASDAIDANTINSLNNYRDYYKTMNQGTFEDQRTNYMATLRDAINSGSISKDKLDAYKGVYNKIYNAKDEAALKSALSELESLEYAPYEGAIDTTYDFTKEKNISKAIKNVPEGSYVTYIDSKGRKVTQKVIKDKYGNRVFSSK